MWVYICIHTHLLQTWTGIRVLAHRMKLSIYFQQLLSNPHIYKDGLISLETVYDLVPQEFLKVLHCWMNQTFLLFLLSLTHFNLVCPFLVLLTVYCCFHRYCKCSMWGFFMLLWVIFSLSASPNCFWSFPQLWKWSSSYHFDSAANHWSGIPYITSLAFFPLSPAHKVSNLCVRGLSWLPVRLINNLPFFFWFHSSPISNFKLKLVIYLVWVYKQPSEPDFISNNPEQM